MLRATQIADALAHAHERGIVHRISNPQRGHHAKGRAKVLDFGRASGYRAG
jgi:hypothetical protein